MPLLMSVSSATGDWGCVGATAGVVGVMTSLLAPCSQSVPPAERQVGASMPSAVHYVGYVEDEETPEMIMAKFSALERIQLASKAAAVQPAMTHMDLSSVAGNETADSGAASDAEERGDVVRPGRSARGGADDLSEEQLLEVFKQTSMFNVRTALADNEALWGIEDLLEHAADRYGADEDVSEDEDWMRSFWSDGEECGPRRQATKGQRKPNTASSGAARVARSAASAKTRQTIVTAYNPHTQALVRRRVHMPDADDLLVIRLPPPPLPTSWGRAVRPWEPCGDGAATGTGAQSSSHDATGVAHPGTAAPAANAGEQGDRVIAVPDVLSADLVGLWCGQTFQALLLNHGWEVGAGTGDASGTVASPRISAADVATAAANLARLPVPHLVPAGFVFVFVQKHLIQTVCRQLVAWGFTYVENLTWVLLAPSNAILRLPARYAALSHITLYMFRRADRGRELELRHQRNPDVTFDCRIAAQASGAAHCVPDEIYTAIETLLPTSAGQRLELWAPRGTPRTGWSHVVTGIPPPPTALV